MRHSSDVVLLYSTEFIREVALKTGIILDPVYTVKAAMGMVEELRKNPTRFRGHRILYLHTGERSMIAPLALVIKTIAMIYCETCIVQLDFDILFSNFFILVCCIFSHLLCTYYICITLVNNLM